jgi:hypothetical protein
MKSLDEKLAILASLSGADPLVKTSEETSEVLCAKVICSECPFMNAELARCNAYNNNEIMLSNKIKVRTYKDATTFYPELFL